MLPSKRVFFSQRCATPVQSPPVANGARHHRLAVAPPTIAVARSVTITGACAGSTVGIGFVGLCTVVTLTLLKSIGVYLLIQLVTIRRGDRR